jgi:hypothetical protein
MPGTQVRDSESPPPYQFLLYVRFSIHRLVLFSFSYVEFSIFKSRHLNKGHTLGKSHFFGAHFSCERDGQPNFKFDMNSEMRYLYRLIPRKFDFIGWLAAFSTYHSGQSLFGSFSERSRPHKTKSACVWVSIDRYTLYRVACKI